VGSAGEALQLLRSPELDPASELVIVAGDELAPPAVPLVEPQPDEGPPGPAAAEIVRYGPEEIEIRADLQVPGYLLLTDAYYPGWQAQVDGQPAPILRADLYFRAIPLEAGAHQVRLRYQPSSLRAGLWITALTLITLASAAALLAVRRVRHR
jgi:hypothetical protein